jgi:hypothetical protein
MAGAVDRSPQQRTLPVLRCPRVRGSIRADGDLHKPPWREIPAVWLVPSHGRDAPAAWSPEEEQALLAAQPPALSPAPAFQPTALRVFRTATHLHVGFRCFDRDIWGSFEGRNAPIYTEEVVEAFLSPSGDPSRYFELEMSPRGAWFEARIESPQRCRRGMRADTDWRCEGWERAVRVHGTMDRRDDVDRAWDVEWAIPFAALGVAGSPPPGTRWRANFFRIDAAGGGQWSAWSPTFADPADFHLPDCFGVLELG